MMTSGRVRSWDACTFIDRPPTTRHMRMSVCLASLVPMSTICCASSLVGVTHTTRITGMRRGLYSSLSSTGRRNAAVLPDPVCAFTRRSFPSMPGGMALACTGVGRTKPNSRTARSRGRDSLSFVKSSISGTLSSIALFLFWFLFFFLTFFFFFFEALLPSSSSLSSSSSSFSLLLAAAFFFSLVFLPSATPPNPAKSPSSSSSSSSPAVPQLSLAQKPSTTSNRCHGQVENKEGYGGAVAYGDRVASLAGGCSCAWSCGDDGDGAPPKEVWVGGVPTVLYSRVLKDLKPIDAACRVDVRNLESRLAQIREKLCSIRDMLRGMRERESFQEERGQGGKYTKEEEDTNDGSGDNKDKERKISIPSPSNDAATNKSSPAKCDRRTIPTRRPDFSTDTQMTSEDTIDDNDREAKLEAETAAKKSPQSTKTPSNPNPLKAMTSIPRKPGWFYLAMVKEYGKVAKAFKVVQRAFITVKSAMIDLVAKQLLVPGVRRDSGGDALDIARDVLLKLKEFTEMYRRSLAALRIRERKARLSASAVPLLKRRRRASKTVLQPRTLSEPPSAIQSTTNHRGQLRQAFATPSVTRLREDHSVPATAPSPFMTPKKENMYRTSTASPILAVSNPRLRSKPRPATVPQNRLRKQNPPDEVDAALASEARRQLRLFSGSGHVHIGLVGVKASKI
mmetsp:Transcript_9434/g.18400  ORF Transcript_9434/g.18400 Transcript_9434/m.18400 type:complete len:679 (-) Transcript_9434:253-2289(-)